MSLGCAVTTESSQSISGLDPNGEHPPSHKRVNQIMMAHPVLAQAKSCEPTAGAIHCEQAVYIYAFFAIDACLWNGSDIYPASIFWAQGSDCYAQNYTFP